MATLYIYIFFVLLYSCQVSPREEAVSIDIKKGQRRFLFDFVYDCKHCYQCACKFQRCPNLNAWEYAGAYTQCAFTLHNLNCQANFHQDGGWTVWSQWSGCQGNCSIPSRKRTRACTNPKPFNCGKKCDGTDTEYDTTCVPQHCQTSTNPSLLLGSTLSQNTSATSTSTPKSQTLSTSSFQSPQQSTFGSASSTSTVYTNANTAPTSSSSPKSNPAMVTQTQTAIVTQTTPAIATQTRPAPLLEDFGSCDTFCTLNSLLASTQAIDDRASICPDGSHGGGDALLIKCCNVTASSQWTFGKKIDGNCDSVPRYSPVASFFFGKSVRGTSGIFLGCTQDVTTGFQMIRQECNETSQVVNVTPEQTRFPDPNTFYVVDSLRK